MSSLHLDWWAAPSDHAFLRATLTWRTTTTPKPSRTWTPSDENAAREEAKYYFNDMENAPQLNQRVLDFQAKHKDSRTTAQRRSLRIPTQARWLYAKSTRATTEQTRINMRKYAWHFIMLARSVQRLRQQKERLISNEVTKAPAALKPIRKFIVDDSNREVTLPTEISGYIQKYYATKWQSTEGAIEKLCTMTKSAEQETTTFSEDEVSAAIVKIKKKNSIDSAGHSALVYEFMPPAIIVKVLQNWVTERSQPSADNYHYINVVHGYARGKKTSAPTVYRILVITPQNTAQTIIDMILSERINRRVDDIFPKSSPTFWEGGRPKTQALDIAHVLGLLIERGLDDRSNVGIATMDIRHYYDCISVPDILARIKRQHDDPGSSFAQSFLRILNLTSLSVECGPEVFIIPPRIRGFLTGSRVAVALARVPILH